MSAPGAILVGTVGQGVHRSADEGQTWQRASVGQGLHSDAIVRCLTPHPSDPQTVFAGTDQGLYKSDDGGKSWDHLDTPINGCSVWALAIDKADPNIVIAGTGTPSPAQLYRSTDGGHSWRQCKAEIAESCPAVGVPRPTAIVFDPAVHSSVWVGLEVDGVLRSRDGGETWERAAQAIRNPDVHNVLVTAGPQKRVFVLVNDDVWVSDDDGATWNAVGVRQVFPWHYPRGIAARSGDDAVFVSIGDATPGRAGAIMRTCDGGRSWESLPLPGQPNSAMWTMTIPPSQPDLMFAASRYGYLYRSEDGGGSWIRLWREFSEVSSLAWLPA